MEFESGQIIVTSDFDEIIAAFTERVAAENLYIKRTDELGIEDAKEVVKEAYVSSKERREIVIAANRYNIYAQNALLKILEEPPKNIVFTLLVRSKSSLLPTILSRMPVKRVKVAQQEAFTFERFDLETLYDLVTQKPKLQKSEAKRILKAMLTFATKQGYALTQKELDYFGKGMQLLELNSNVSTVLTTAGLILLTHKKRRR